MKQYVKYHQVREYQTLTECFGEIGQLYSTDTAFTFYERDGKERTISYPDFVNDVYALAHSFCERKMNGKHIAIAGQNSYEWVLVFCAAGLVGCTVIPIDIENSEKEMVRKFFHPRDFILTDSAGKERNRKYSRGGNIVFRDFESDREMEKIRRSVRMEKPDFIVILGSRKFVAEMYGAMREFRTQARFVTSNNVSICCGEGICGACEITLRSGEKIRMCKCSESADPEELFAEPVQSLNR